MHHVQQLFKNTDVNDQGEITWEDFSTQLDNKDMKMYFKAIDISVEEAKELFQLIDRDDSGTIDCNELVNSCLQLRGPAKALTLATLVREQERWKGDWKVHKQRMEAAM